MRALVTTQSGRASEVPEEPVGPLAPFVELRELEKPAPKPGQVLIEVELALVNPSDEMFIRGLYGLPRREGVPAGFEGVGTVVEHGGGLIGRAMMGRRVAFFADPSARGSGTWGELAVTDAAICIPVGSKLRSEDAAGFLVNPFTAWALDELASVSGSDAFLMSAAGSQMGKFLISLASSRGRRPIAIVRRNEQIGPLKAFGAAHVLNESEDGFEDKLREVLKAERPIAFLDAVAGPKQARVFEMMGDRARWVVYGRLDATPPKLERPEQLIFKRKMIEGFWLSDWFKDASFLTTARASRAIRKRFESGEWKTDVTGIVPLGEAVERVPDELAKKDGKVFIRP